MQVSRPQLLPTGIDVLDRKLGGGIPAGSVVLLGADPASQSEQFLYELTVPRRTLYLTTERPTGAVRSAIEWGGGSPGTTDVYAVDAKDPVGDALGRIADLPQQGTLIVDPIDVLERTGGDDLRKFLIAVSDTVAEQGGYAFFHGLDGRQVSEQRDVTEYLADVVFDLHTTVRGESIENRLIVPKFRGGKPFEEAVKLELTERVAIDTSRDIA